MAKFDDIEVPEGMIESVRTYYGDRPEFNRLIEGTEVSDEKIKLAIKLYVNHFNQMPPKITATYKPKTFPDGMILIKGAVIELLTMSGIIHSRNHLNFSDANVNFSINDKASDYQRWIQQLVQENRQQAKDLKVGINAEEGFDMQPSPEAAFPWWT